MKSLIRCSIGVLFFSTVVTAQIETTMFKQTLTGDFADNSEQSTFSHKSKGRAVLFSMLVPGTGELYLGNNKMGAIFIGSELTLIGSYYLMNWVSDVKRDDYRTYSSSHAGVNVTGKPHQFFVNIENYNSLDDYNQAVLQRRNTRDLYPDEALWQWEWDSDSSRKRFKRMRVSSDRYKNASLFAIGGLVLNHIVSVIDVLRITNQHNLQNQTEKSTHVYFSALPEGGMRVSLLKVF